MAVSLENSFQLGQQPIGCQEVPAWQPRMRDRELAMPICLGRLPPGWIEAQGLIPFPEQPSLRETLWLLLPEGRVLGSATVRHLIRILRQRVEKAEEALLGDGEITEDHDDTLGHVSSQSGPSGGASRFYALTA